MRRTMLWGIILILASAWSVSGYDAAAAEEAVPDQEEDFLIVKYGTVHVKSALPDAKVYIDEAYRGPVNTAIPKVITGERVISVTLQDKTVTGTFTIRKNETLNLEARFKEGKLVAAAGDRDEKAKKAAKPERKREAAASRKTAAEERQELHVNVFKLEFRNRDHQEVGIVHRANAKIISGYTEKKSRTGKYYRTKQGQLLCEAGPCAQEWTAKFFYLDEQGNRDAFLVTWKRKVFSGITPTGTSEREITWCLNGECRKAEDTDSDAAPHELELGRYVLTWSKKTAVFRRADLVKKIRKAGGTVPE